MPKFLKSANNINTDFPIDNVLEFCFVGRSNTGKSSVINALANADIAKHSKTPGRTQLVNLFDFDTFRLIDLPGYGYARLSKSLQDKISIMMGEYMSNRKNLFAVFQVCDIRTITKLDIAMSKFIQSKFAYHFVILNKVDLVNKSFFDNNKEKIAKELLVSTENLIPFSAAKKINVALVKQKMNQMVKHNK